jgi:hypothetical protein
MEEVLAILNCYIGSSFPLFSILRGLAMDFSAFLPDELGSLELSTRMLDVSARRNFPIRS